MYLHNKNKYTTCTCTYTCTCTMYICALVHVRIQYINTCIVHVYRASVVYCAYTARQLYMYNAPLLVYYLLYSTV